MHPLLSTSWEWEELTSLKKRDWRAANLPDRTELSKIWKLMANICTSKPFYVARHFAGAAGFVALPELIGAAIRASLFKRFLTRTGSSTHATYALLLQTSYRPPLASPLRSSEELS